MKELIEKLEEAKRSIETVRCEEWYLNLTKEDCKILLQALQQRESDKKIDLAIKEFERLKEKATSLRDTMYLDGVLAVLDGIKALPTPPNK